MWERPARPSLSGVGSRGFRVLVMSVTPPLMGALAMLLVFWEAVWRDRIKGQDGGKGCFFREFF